MKFVICHTRILSSIALSILIDVWHSIEAKQATADSVEALDTDEKLLLKICRLKFYPNVNEECNLDVCVDRMLNEQKPGDCPSAVNTSLGQAQCFDDCNGHDYRCVGTQKCCSNGCHRICVNPLNLDAVDVLALPAIPTNVTVVTVEPEMRRKARIAWDMQYHSGDGIELFDFIVEARVHIGHTFSPHKLSHWFTIRSIGREIQQTSDNSLRVSSILPLKIGRWYEYRVAAVNRNGTRGYSEPSKSFQLNETPKSLPNPTNFTIETPPQLLPNNSVHSRVAWKSPITDYPIEKYEFSWSFYIREGDGSLFMEKALVPETKRYFEFWNLLPNSYYYLQVHGVSSFGRKRLKSGKIWLSLNTTDLS